jgi:uncharacterized RDD family membrane protein YckC
MTLLPRRLGAFATDALLVAISASALEPSAAAMTNSLISWPVASLPMIGLLGGLVGRLGYTPGKRIFSLNVTQDSGGKPGIGRGMAREAIRFLSLPIFVLPVLYLATLSARGKTPYDEYLRLRVVKN